MATSRIYIPNGLFNLLDKMKLNDEESHTQVLIRHTIHCANCAGYIKARDDEIKEIKAKARIQDIIRKIKLNASDTFTKQRSLKMMMVLIIDESVDIKKAHAFVDDFKKMGELLKEDWKEFNLTEKKIRILRKQATLNRQCYPLWEKLSDPKKPDDITRWYNEVTTNRQGAMPFRRKKYLEAKRVVAEQLQAPELLDKTSKE